MKNVSKDNVPSIQRGEQLYMWHTDIWIARKTPIYQEPANSAVSTKAWMSSPYCNARSPSYLLVSTWVSQMPMAGGPSIPLGGEIQPLCKLPIESEYSGFGENKEWFPKAWWFQSKIIKLHLPRLLPNCEPQWCTPIPHPYLVQSLAWRSRSLSPWPHQIQPKDDCLREGSQLSEEMAKLWQALPSQHPSDTTKPRGVKKWW